MGWTPEQLPSLAGKTYAITGGNSGLGLEAARILLQRGAKVVITTRSEAKARGAVDTLRQAVPDADVDFVLLDLSEPASITAAAPQLRDKTPNLHGFINNAGVMQTPHVKTSEGFELQLATNHLGHFRINAALIDHFESCGTRIVAVSSIAHKYGTIHFDDLMLERGYDPTVAYFQSKLANILYAFELQRRLAARGSQATAYACHPGYAATNLQSAGVGMDGGSRFYKWMYSISNKLLAQTAEEGAYPLVLAAAAADARPGAYYGPTGLMQSRGAVGESYVAPRALDEAVAARLWDATEALVGPFFG